MAVRLQGKLCTHVLLKFQEESMGLTELKWKVFTIVLIVDVSWERGGAIKIHSILPSVPKTHKEPHTGQRESLKLLF